MKLTFVHAPLTAPRRDVAIPTGIFPMPDVFANITSVPADMIDTVADVLETRAAIPSQVEMLHDYLARIEFPEKSKGQQREPKDFLPGAQSLTRRAAEA